MNNKVEILKALVYDKEDFDEFQNLEYDFSDKEIEFIVEYKKIYELGTSQLYKFIDKLDEEGFSELDSYSILYYTTSILNGPLGNYARDYVDQNDKKYFKDLPDSLGVNGNKTFAPSNTVVYENMTYPLGCSVDTYNRLPKFTQDILQDSIKQVEDMFSSNLRAITVHDNTLPIVDKKPKDRYDSEKEGKVVKEPVANYAIKDSYFYLAVSDVSEDIFEKVKETLGEEEYELYKDSKQFNPFDSTKNESVSKNDKFEKLVKDLNDNEQVINIDLEKEEITSFADLAKVLKIDEKEYNLNTNEQQLGK